MLLRGLVPLPLLPPRLIRRAWTSGSFLAVGGRQRFQLPVVNNRTLETIPIIDPLSLLNSQRRKPVIEKFLVVRHSGYEVEELVVGNRVRPDDLPREFVHAPREDQVSKGDKVKDNGGQDRQYHGQVTEIRDGEVEKILHPFAEARYITDRVLHRLGHLLDRLQPLLQTFLLFLEGKKGESSSRIIFFVWMKLYNEENT